MNSPTKSAAAELAETINQILESQRRCLYCGRRFPTKHGRRVHEGQCPKGPR